MALNTHKMIAPAVIFLLLSQLLMSSLFIVFSTGAIGYTVHSPIIIDGDSDFIPANGVVSGNGTPENPYLIEGWEINYSVVYGILVKNTRASFMIQSVSVLATISNALRLENVSNGMISDAQIRSTTGVGISISKASNVTISNCSIEKMTLGMSIEQSEDFVIKDNSVRNLKNKLLYVFNCKDSMIENNILRDSDNVGLEMLYVNETTIRRNAIINASEGISLYDCRKLVFYNNVISLHREATLWTEKCSSIKWNTSYPTGGNYWSEYYGLDNYSGPSQNQPGSDGIIDVAYTIVPLNVDVFPLLKPPLTDASPPFTKSEIVGTLSVNGWYKEGANIVLNAIDNFSGILDVYYAVDSYIYKVYSSPIRVSTTGEHIIRYYAIDRAGNNETSKYLMFKVDSTEPEASLLVEGTRGENRWYLSAVSVRINATDNESGVDSIWYSLDAADTEEYSSFILITSDGYHSLGYYTIDIAGNMGDFEIEDINIDSMRPSLTLEQQNGTLYTSISATISWIASDETSGIDHYEISIDGEGFSRISGSKKSYTIPRLTDGEHKIVFIAYDKAGLITTRELTITVNTGILGLLMINLGTIIALIAAIVFVAVLLLIRRRIIQSRQLPKRRDREDHS